MVYKIILQRIIFIHVNIIIRKIFPCSLLKFSCRKVCPWWLSFFIGNTLRRFIHNPDRILADLIKNGQTVVDIGCGPGFFTITMAEMVGEDGSVIAADIQSKMLDFVHDRAVKAGLESRIQFHHCNNDGIDIEDKVDFILAFYMVHEVKDIESFFAEIVNILRPNATFLLVEPKIHVTSYYFEKTVKAAINAGLKPMTVLNIKGSRSLLFCK